MGPYEAILVGFLLATAMLPIALRWMRWRSVPWVVAIVVLVYCGATAVTWSASGLRDRPMAESQVSDRPIAVADQGYTMSGACRSCHPQQYDTWHASYHRTMTQVARPDNVVGDFNNVTLTQDGQNFHLWTHEGERWVTSYPTAAEEREAEPASGQRQDRKVVMMTGSHHMQFYWLASGESRKLALLPFVYLIDEQEWIPETASFLQPPGAKPASGLGQWNTNCIKCHVTHGQARAFGQQMDTRVVEFGIACEACHGPAEHHVDVNADPQRRYQFHLSQERDPTVIQPKRMSKRLESQVCGQCHSITEFHDVEDERKWYATGYPYKPGDDLEQSRIVVQPKEISQHPRMQAILRGNPTFLRERYWADGMVRVSGREYNGLIESPCYTHDRPEERMSCMDCHVLHQWPDDPRPTREWANDQLGMGMDNDQACLQCHDEYRQQIESHSHHRADSDGARCYNCHMPYTTYGLLKAIRSHQVDSPSVAASLRTGRPNACNQCHLDRSLEWTGRYLQEWYDIPPVPLEKDDAGLAASILWTLRGDAGQRALMAWSMGWESARQASGQSWLAPYLAELMVDPYDAVRFIAYRSLKRLAGYENVEYDFVGPLAQRETTRQRVLEIWRAGASDRQARDELLIGSNGGLDGATFDRLLQQRDHQPLGLAE